MKQLLFVLFFYGTFLGISQPIFHIGSDQVYGCGEGVPFKVEGIETAPEKAAYFSINLLDSQGQSAFKQLIRTFSGSILGEFKIPETLVSGTYLMVFSGLGSAGLTEIYRGPLQVINFSTFSKDQTGECCDGMDLTLMIKPTSEDPLIIKGKIEHKTNHISDQVVMLQARGDTRSIKTVKTDAAGYFSFSNILLGEVELLLSTPGLSDAKITLLSNPYSLEQPNELKPWKLPESVLHQTMLTQKLIAINYPEKAPVEEKDVAQEWDRIIFPDKFIKLGSTEEIYRELLPLTRVKTAGKGKSIYLLNVQNNMFYKSMPLFLIDGFRVADINQLFDLPQDNIYSISLKYGPVSRDMINKYGGFAYYGVFSLVTRFGKQVPDDGNYQKGRGFITY